VSWSNSREMLPGGTIGSGSFEMCLHSPLFTVRIISGPYLWGDATCGPTCDNLHSSRHRTTWKWLFVLLICGASLQEDCKLQPHTGLLNLEIIGNDEHRSSSLVHQSINHHWLWQLIYLDWRKRYYDSSFLAGTSESIIWR
jgi:hypothetical protein